MGKLQSHASLHPEAEINEFHLRPVRGNTTQGQPGGGLVVTIASATNIPKMDLIGHSDTYVKVALRGEGNQKEPIAVTSVVSGADPVWREDVELPFESWDPEARLTFTLWDADTTTSDDYIGEATVRLSTLLRRSVRLLLIQGPSGDPVMSTGPTPEPCELLVAVRRDSIPPSWPVPAPSSVAGRTFPRHLFMMSRGTRGDVQV